jgi:hypothetical protein
VVQAAVEAGFEFNSAINGIPLEKFVKETGRGRHSAHPNYTSQIRGFLVQWVDNPANTDWTPNDAKDLIEAMVDDIRSTIQNTSAKINDLDLGL